jgi:tetratricopeptide (TPR) repeat protein
MSFFGQAATISSSPPPDGSSLRKGRLSVLPENKQDGPQKAGSEDDLLPASEVPLRHRYVSLAVCGLLLLAIGLVFSQTARFQFINLDDGRCIYDNPHVTAGWTASGVVWALTGRYAGSGWAPVAWMSHMAVWQCFGDNAGAHHVASVLVHAAAAVLLFLVLRSMTGRLWPSALVAALFAIHPLRVESVVWATCRKDVLSGFFFVLTLAAHANYVRHPFSFRRYAAVLISFALAIMSKATVVTLPAVLLLLDYWPFDRMTIGGGRARFRDPSEVFSSWIPMAAKAGPTPSAATTCPTERATSLRSRLVGLVLEKVPFLVLVAVSSIQHLRCEKDFDIVFPEDHVPFAWRIGNGIVSYVAYLWQIVWPVDLSLLYPHPGIHLPIWKIICAAVILSCISMGAFAIRRRCPYVLVGWLWFVGMMLPASGVVEFGGGIQAMADRFTYLSQIGLYLAFAWAMADACRCWSWHRWALGGTSALVLAVLMGCAWRQTTFWRDSETLWKHTVTCFPRHAVAYHHLGFALSSQGRIQEALQHYRKAYEIKPHLSVSNYNLGLALATLGQLDEAMSYYRRSLEIQPNSAEVHSALAAALAMQGRLDEAQVNYRKSLQIEPNDALAHEGLSSISLSRGRLDEAAAHCQRALQLNPDLAMAHNNMGVILARRGQIPEALAHYQRALQIQPNLSPAHINAGDMLATQGQFHDALEHYRAALKMQPQDPMALRSLAWLRATCPDASLRNAAEAVELAQRANQLCGEKQPEVLDTLAAAYAATGWFPEAVATARKALELARQQDNRPLADTLQERLSGYEAGRPYRQHPLSSPSP